MRRRIQYIGLRFSLSCMLLQTHDVSETASVLSSDRNKYHETYPVVSGNKCNLNLTDQTKQLYVDVNCRG